MNLSELVTHTRCNVLRDISKPSLWSDAEIVLHLNQAEREFAIKTHNIIDDQTADYCTFDTVVGQQVYDLHDKVVAVKAAGVAEYDTTDPQNPVLTNYTWMRDETSKGIKRLFLSGKPLCYTAQARSKAIRLDRSADAVYTIEMEVARKPKNDMSRDKDTPEIDEEYHIYLCDFAAWQCLTNNDPEGANMQAAATFRAKWDLTIRDAKRAMSVMRSGRDPQARGNWTGKRYRSTT